MIIGTVIKVDVDQFKNINVWVNFKENDVDIVQYDSKGEIVNADGVPAWCLKMIWQNTIGKTDEEIEEWIKTNIEYQIGNFIKQKFHEIKNQELALDRIKNFVGKSTSLEAIDIDVDGIICTIKPDGTLIEQEKIIEGE